MSTLGIGAIPNLFTPSRGNHSSFSHELHRLFPVYTDELPATASVSPFSACMREHMEVTQTGMAALESTAGEMKSTVGEMKQEWSSIAAVVNKLLLVSVEGRDPCPRLIEVDKGIMPTSTSSRRCSCCRTVMEFLRCTAVKPKVQKPCYRVRFLCAHDKSPAVCGPDGQGYIVESEEEWQLWMRKLVPLIKVSGWQRKGAMFGLRGGRYFMFIPGSQAMLLSGVSLLYDGVRSQMQCFHQ